MIARWALLLAVAATPAVFLPAANDVFGLPKLAVVACAVAVAALATAWDGVGRMPRPAVVPFAAAFLLAFAVATLASISRVTSVFGGYERYGGLVPTLVYVAFAALVVVHGWRQPERLVRDLSLALLAGGLVAAVYILFQAAGLDPLDWQEKSGAAVRYQAGTLGNSNFAAGYLGATLPLFWPLFAAQPVRLRRLAVAVAALVYAAALIATQGRGGLLAALVGSLVLLTAGSRQIWRDPAVKRAGGMVAAVAVVVVGLLAVRLDVFRTESLGVRGREWAAGIAMFADRPVLGAGPDTYGLLYPQYRTVADGRALGLQIADKPHNVFIEYGATTGIVGLAAFAALIAAVGRAGWRRRAEAAPFLAVGAGYLAQAVFSLEVPALALLFWVTVAAVVAAADPALAAGRVPAKGKARNERSRVRVLPVAAAGVLAAALLAATAVGLSADVAAASGSVHRASQRNPWQPAYAVLEGATLERLGAEADDQAARARFLTDAIRAYRRAHDLEPRSLLAVLGLARTHTLVGRGVDPKAFPEADRWWAEAARLDPRDWEVHEGYGVMLNSWANAGGRDQRPRAAEELRLALAIRPDRVPTLLTLARIDAALGDLAGARTSAERALALEPGNTHAQAVIADLDAQES